MILHHNQLNLMISVREFDTQNLYGNISGYIGLFLGYSLFQIPSLLRFIYYFIKEYWQVLANRHLNVKRIKLSEVSVMDVTPMERNIPQELEEINYEFNELSQKLREVQKVLIVKNA